MQPESQQDERGSSQTQSSTNTCPNCQAAMPPEMRFCRQCGHRLGEGVAEYTETVRLPYSQAAGRATANPQNRTQAPFEMPYWGAIARDARGRAINGTATCAEWPAYRRKRRRRPWFIWPIIGVALATMAGGSILPLRVNLGGRRPAAVASAPRSYAGVNEFKNADGGVTFDSISPPGSAADRAGLVGGDIITGFDGRTVRTADEMINLLTMTPIGKSVDVTFIRDGETKTAKMTTVSQEENSRLDAVASSLPKGYLGISDFDRVQIPNSNTYGIQIEVRRNRPADIAGLRDGDIITDFNDTPIRTTGELRARIGRAAPGSTVKVVVVRDGQRMEIPVKMGQDD